MTYNPQRALDLLRIGSGRADANFREDQEDAIRHIVDGRGRLLVVQKTGWGKSFVYFIATKLLRDDGNGPALLISPLLALMRNQIAAAERMGVRAATINSDNVDDWTQVEAKLARGEIDILLISPERLANERFRTQVLAGIAAQISMLVIDEAHCISDWGHDFRPHYRLLERIVKTLPLNLRLLATTATANNRVMEDLAAVLGPKLDVSRGDLNRTSLSLQTIRLPSQAERLAWLAEQLATLQGHGIIYTLTVRDANQVADWLKTRGFNVEAYTGETGDRREALEQALLNNEVKALVATTALGMGYDKPDLAFCIHVGSPASPVAYYQQIGRAGRALDNALGVLLPSESDEPIWEYFATASIPEPDNVDRVMGVLNNGPASVAALENVTGLRRNRIDALLKMLATYEVVEKQGTEWCATGATYVHDHQKWADLRIMRNKEANVMRSYASGEGCLMQFLQIALDDPEPAPCGRCSVCTGVLPAPGTRPTDESMAAAKQFARTATVVLEPRKLWPAGIPGRKGRIVGCEEGRALAFADDPGWIDELRLLALGDAPIDSVVADGLVAVLSRWRNQWPARPVAVVPTPSRRHPMRVASIAAHIAQIGKLPLLDALVAAGAAPPTDIASGARVTALAAGLRLRDDIEIPRGPILLVDDTYRSGWTMTIAAALLRSAGATAVLPLVVHQLP